MLKKLVKYGNSNALVLDRSIMALLDLNEGDAVKLRIEGDALIIKGEKKIKPTESLMLDFENIRQQSNSEGSTTDPCIAMIEKGFKEYCQNAEQDPAKMAEVEKWVSGTENAKQLQDAYQKIFAKYKDVVEVFSTPEFVAEVNALKARYQDNPTSEEFQKEFLELRVKHAPGVEAMDQEMRDLQKEFQVPN